MGKFATFLEKIRAYTANQEYTTELPPPRIKPRDSSEKEPIPLSEEEKEKIYDNLYQAIVNKQIANVSYNNIIHAYTFTWNNIYCTVGEPDKTRVWIISPEYNQYRIKISGEFIACDDKAKNIFDILKYRENALNKLGEYNRLNFIRKQCL